jgi:hypothetical protein
MSQYARSYLFSHQFDFQLNWARLFYLQTQANIQGRFLCRHRPDGISLFCYQHFRDDHDGSRINAYSKTYKTLLIRYFLGGKHQWLDACDLAN